MSSSTPTTPEKGNTEGAVVPQTAVDNTIARLKERVEPAPAPVPPAPKVKHVVNSSSVKATVKLRNANGKEDYIHVMGRRKAKLPEGHTVDPNYLVLNKHVKVVEV